MILTLNKKEIEEAVRQYTIQKLSGTFVNMPNFKITFDITAPYSDQRDEYYPGNVSANIEISI